MKKSNLNDERLLCVELSSPEGSLAIWAGGACVAAEGTGPFQRNQRHVFDTLDRLLEAAGCRAEDIDAYVVGRGPGNYSGMRAAFALCHAMALPGGRPVLAFSSGEALACEASADLPEGGRMAVVGDARRALYWYGLFRRTGEGVEPVGDWSLAGPEALAEALSGVSLILSSDRDRLNEKLPPALLSAEAWHKAHIYPTARALGALAIRRMKSGQGSEPLEPLYMHPPVFVPPAREGHHA